MTLIRKQIYRWFNFIFIFCLNPRSLQKLWIKPRYLFYKEMHTLNMKLTILIKSQFKVKFQYFKKPKREIFMQLQEKWTQSRTKSVCVYIWITEIFCCFFFVAFIQIYKFKKPRDLKSERKLWRKNVLFQIS